MVAIGNGVNFTSEDGINFVEHPVERTDNQNPSWAAYSGPDYFNLTPQLLPGVGNGEVVCCTLVHYEDRLPVRTTKSRTDDRTTATWDGETLAQYSGAYARAMSPAKPKLWDGTQFIAEARGPFPNHSRLRSQQMLVSDDGETWDLVSGGYFADGPMAYGGGVYVGGNSLGRVSYSADLDSWVQSRSNISQDWLKSFRAAHYAAGIFVLVGDFGLIVKTADGTVPQVVKPTVYLSSMQANSALDASQLLGITHTGTTWVMVGTASGIPAIYTGSSLNVLTSVDCPYNRIFGGFDGEFAGLRAVHYAGGRLVAVGAKAVKNRDFSIKTNPLIITSTDGGATWSDVSFYCTIGADVGAYLPADLWSVVRLDSGLWIAVGMNCDATSTDGVTWVPRPHKRNYIPRVYRDPPIFQKTRSHLVTNGTLAICNVNENTDFLNTIESTTDGVNWTAL